MLECKTPKIYKMPKIKTEITELIKFRNQYENATTEARFIEAEEYLCKVHDKFGTIEVSAIRNLIK